MGTDTATPSNSALDFAIRIASAVFEKLQLKAQYDVVVRQHAGPLPMPWIDIAWTRKGAHTGEPEYCISLPQSHYEVVSKEERNKVATYIYKTTAMMLGKLEPK